MDVAFFAKWTEAAEKLAVRAPEREIHSLLLEAWEQGNPVHRRMMENIVNHSLEQAGYKPVHFPKVYGVVMTDVCNTRDS